MDLAYLRAHPRQLPVFLKHQRIRETPISGGGICAASRLTLDDGSSLFTKVAPGDRPLPGFFEAEAAGLAWLREAGAVPIPEVIAVLPDRLALEWVDPAPATPAVAERFGRELAALHRSGAATFGAGWPGYIGSLPMDNTPSGGPWAEWFGERRLRPYLRMSADRGALSAADVEAVEGLIKNIRVYAGQPAADPPARLHGDLWPGNVLWAADRAWLIDPAAQGGHRETDLANLALFGAAPHLDRVLAGYQAVWPLAPGWPERVPLHQLHLLLVHTALFGSSYRPAVMSAVRATVDR